MIGPPARPPEIAPHGIGETTHYLKLSHNQISEGDTLTVSLRVRNTGSFAGKEIVQLYVRDVESTVFRPDKELKGFIKVELQPGEECDVSIELNQRAFAAYHTDLKDWHTESGTFEILAGASSGDIRLTTSVEVVSTQPAAPAVDRQKLAAYYDFPKDSPVSQADFEALLGRPVPLNQGSQNGKYSLNTPVGDMSDSFIGRRLYSFMQTQMAKLIAGQEDTPTGLMMESMASEMPLRGILMMGDGSITREILEALLLLINGSFFKGLSAMIKAMWQKGK
ncbi:MAG: fibronectin type III-like domain-contianing protein [Anaerolineales bacterium]|nr:fibronectin type III-like domain-contianing protein [Anaerolineales bacterium]